MGVLSGYLENSAKMCIRVSRSGCHLDPARLCDTLNPSPQPPSPHPHPPRPIPPPQELSSLQPFGDRRSAHYGAHPCPRRAEPGAPQMHFPEQPEMVVFPLAGTGKKSVGDSIVTSKCSPEVLVSPLRLNRPQKSHENGFPLFTQSFFTMKPFLSCTWSCL